MDSGVSWPFWRKKIQSRLSETKEFQFLETALIFAASFGPTSFKICISISDGISSKAPSDEDDDDDLVRRFRSDESPLVSERFDTDSHTFLNHIVMAPQLIQFFMNPEISI